MISYIGKVKHLIHLSTGLQLTIDFPPAFLEDVNIGDSIAVSGPCLTVTKIEGTAFTVSVSQETLQRSTITRWKAGRNVNLEKSLRSTDRLGGHFVMGHIDGVAKVTKKQQSGEGSIFTFETIQEIASMIAPKGSVSLDGISLTPASKSDSNFTVAIIPHTLSHTTFYDLSVTDEVNIEIDIFARYMFEFLKQQNKKDISGSTLKIDDLRSEGY
ncbi:MAG: riboflavin synthase [bacterium]